MGIPGKFLLTVAVSRVPGGTSLEPGSPSWQEVVRLAEDLIYRGFPASRVVLELSPVLPACIRCRGRLQGPFPVTGTTGALNQTAREFVRLRCPPHKAELAGVVTDCLLPA